VLPDVKVLNIKHYYWNESPLTIYVGRRVYRFEASPLANPFKIGASCNREQSIRQYRRWLWAEIQKKSAVYTELCRLKDLAEANSKLTLCCWCAPQPCHGNIISDAIKWLIEMETTTEQNKLNHHEQTIERQ
jgi:Domain of unknown function (DUF4326)